MAIEMIRVDCIFFLHIWFFGKVSIMSEGIIAILIVSSASIFTVLPVTKYVYLNDTVNFECATNLTGYDLIFTIGGVIQHSATVSSLPNGGKKISISQVATAQLNGTGVVCRARHAVNDDNVTETVYIYVQG